MIFVCGCPGFRGNYGRTLRIDVYTGTSGTQLLSSSAGSIGTGGVVWPIGSNARTFAMPGNQTSIIVRFTNTSGSNGDPVCSWISISEQGLIPPNSKVENYTDQFNYGWYSWNDANAAVMTYELALPAGDYALATGIHEFWPQEGVDVNRLYTIDVTDGDGKVLATVNNTL